MEGERHKEFMRLALNEARKSPPKPSNFCVGACLVAPRESQALLVTGYTLECPGNTHAEQCCFIKLAQQYCCAEEDLGKHLVEPTVLYTTMEPCIKRSHPHTPCVDRILQLKTRDGRQAISAVYIGVSEPEKFVGANDGQQRLLDAGIAVEHVPGFEDEILRVATAGHS